MSPNPEDLSPSSPHRPTNAAERADIAQMFTLIDGILPFEACLYYQVVPLSIQGSRLNLGMVNPNDHTAADYVRRLVSYINCSIAPLKISSDWHRDVLSRYLSHTATAQPTPEAASTSTNSAANSAAATEKVAPSETQETFITADVSSPPSPPPRRHSPPPDIQSTLVVDSPEELLDELTPSPKIPATHPVAKANVPSANRRPLRPSSPATKSPNLSTKPTEADGQKPLQPGKTAPLHLYLDATYRTSPLKSLANLPPKPLMQALLSRVLDEGIGRLYFERSATHGRVLWSQDGVPKSILNNLQPAVFQSVINEFKLLTHLSLISVENPKQVEIERLYEGNRVLLRFRVMPGSHGEEATLQVLRGAALKFHQQQQIDKLGRDALSIAQKLQQKIYTIRDRAQQNLSLSSNCIDSLPVIVQMLKQMETQVQALLSEKDMT